MLQRENLKLTVEARIRMVQSFPVALQGCREAGKRSRAAAMKGGQAWS
jgi:hypothetical protein